MQFFLEIDLFGLERRKQKETRNIFQQIALVISAFSKVKKLLFVW